MKLYTYFRSSASYRARIALNLKGLAYEAIPVDLRPAASVQRQPDFLAVNPHGLVPVLEDGGITISQSLALIEYLEDTHPEPPLLPRAPVDRARVRAMALAVACDIHPLNNLRVLNYLRSPLGADEDAVNTWYRHWVAEGLRGLEANAKELTGDGRHMFGTSVTLADVCLVPQMYNARRFHCDLGPYPTLRAICAHLETLSPFTAAAPETQPDAPA